MSQAPVQIFACQNRTCHRAGSAEVLSVLQSQIQVNSLTGQINLQATGCLGQCGNGPMLVVLQVETRQEIWYDRVRVEEVPLLVQEHLLSGRPVSDMLYRTRHPRSSPTWTPLPPPWQAI